ncbi:hypothetical protein FHX47_002060 [Garicola koreensis]|uniref:Uncharacterized protein n=1 Tax=Garicola koreensis TaxID=1262554 RepID=A0A7W5TSM6_9MICC|nr:hypothetical protein [Garicola koreensis]
MEVASSQSTRDPAITTELITPRRCRAARRTPR